MVEARDGDVLSINPRRVPRGSAVAVTFEGVVGSDLTWVGWSSTGTCGANPEGAVAITSGVSSTLANLPTDGVWHLCYSTAGGGPGSYVRMSNATTGAIEVVSAGSNTITDVMPLTVGLDAGTPVALPGLPGTGFTSVALVANGGDCAVGPLFNNVTVTTDDGPLFVTDATLTTGDYNLCLRVRFLLPACGVCCVASALPQIRNERSAIF